jgi:y4mF family transcriptional regulator
MAAHDTRAFGASVREMRKTSQLTQAELAAAAGVGLRFLIELEAGKPTVRLGLALQVLDALNATMLLLPQGASNG